MTKLEIEELCRQYGSDVRWLEKPHIGSTGSVLGVMSGFCKTVNFDQFIKELEKYPNALVCLYPNGDNPIWHEEVGYKNVRVNICKKEGQIYET